MIDAEEIRKIHDAMADAQRTLDFDVLKKLDDVTSVLLDMEENDKLADLSDRTMAIYHLLAIYHLYKAMGQIYKARDVIENIVYRYRDDI